MIDCDLKESTNYALNFIKPSLQEGTILIFDDFLDYKGSMEKGECGAFEDFKRENPKRFFLEEPLIMDIEEEPLLFTIFKFKS